MKIDINCDMGESFATYELGNDKEMIKYISSANIACGFHAGDPGWMRKTVTLAEKHGVSIGAHPSFPDLKGFGRRNMDVSPKEVEDDVTYQIGALAAFTKTKRLAHVKPHGSMYNMAANDENLAEAICNAVLKFDKEMILIVLAGTKWVNIAQNMNLQVAQEVFADRAFAANGSLVPRGKPGAVIHDIDTVVKRSVKMITEKKVTSITGEEIKLEMDTLCVHSDTPNATKLASKINHALVSAKVEISAINKN